MCTDLITVPTWYEFRITKGCGLPEDPAYLQAAVRVHGDFQSEHLVESVALFERERVEGLGGYAGVVL